MVPYRYAGFKVPIPLCNLDYKVAESVEAAPEPVVALLPHLCSHMRATALAPEPLLLLPKLWLVCTVEGKGGGRGGTWVRGAIRDECERQHCA